VTDIGDLFERIQQQALDSSVPLADTLRLCVAVGGRLGAPELIQWATAELNGYRPEDELPEYRKVHAPLLMNYQHGPTWATGQAVTANLVDEPFRSRMYDVPLREPLHALEATARVQGGDGSVTMTEATGGALQAMIQRNANASFFGVSAVYWSIPRTTFGSVVDQVRTKLVEMVAVFDVAVAKPGTDATAAARSAIHVVVEPGGTMNVNSAPDGTVVGGSDHAVVTSNSAGRDVTATTSGRDATTSTTETSTTSEPPRKPKFWETSWWTIGRVVVGAIALLAALAAAYFTFLTVDAGRLPWQ